MTSATILRQEASSSLSQVCDSSSDSVRLHAHELLAEAFLQRRRFGGLDDRPEQRGEDFLRRAGGRQHALPVQRADAGVAGLGERRDVGVVREARARRGPRSAAGCPALIMAAVLAALRTAACDVADDEVVDHAGGAGLVRDVQHVDAGASGEDLHVEVREAADAGAGELRTLPGFFLAWAIELGRRSSRSKFAVGRDQERRIDGEAGHRRHALVEVDRRTCSGTGPA